MYAVLIESAGVYYLKLKRAVTLRVEGEVHLAVAERHFAEADLVVYQRLEVYVNKAHGVGSLTARGKSVADVLYRGHEISKAAAEDRGRGRGIVLVVARGVVISSNYHIPNLAVFYEQSCLSDGYVESRAAGYVVVRAVVYSLAS